MGHFSARATVNAELYREIHVDDKANIGHWKQRHNNALLSPNTEEERILLLITAWVNYAETSEELYGCKVGSDYVAHPAFVAMAQAIRTFLNYDLGRLDAGTLDAFVNDFAASHDASLEEAVEALASDA